jgi:hypothetical protein
MTCHWKKKLWKNTNSNKHFYIILHTVFKVGDHMIDSSYINSKSFIIWIFKNVNILTQKNSKNKILGRKIFNLHKCFIKFEINYLFNIHVSKLPRYYNQHKLFYPTCFLPIIVKYMIRSNVTTMGIVNLASDLSLSCKVENEKYHRNYMLQFRKFICIKIGFE